MRTTRSAAPWAAALFAVATLARPTAAQELDEIARGDLGDGRAGLVAALLHEGELDFIQAWGAASTETGEEMGPGHLFAFPNFTEVLMAVTVRALADAGQIDAHAPIGGYLPGLAEGLGEITLDQLLTHTAGLDDAELPPGMSMDRALSQLDERSLLATPGSFYSRSRYSYPLAAKVLERAGGMPLTDLLTLAVIQPLGMLRTTFDVEAARERGLAQGYRLGTNRDWVPTGAPTTMAGLPVVFTSAPDLLQFAAAWMGGGIRGAHPVPETFPGADVTGGDRFRDGVWVDRYRGADRVYLQSVEVGYGVTWQLYPETMSSMVAWSPAAVPAGSSDFLADRLADAMGLLPIDEVDNRPSPALPAPDWAGTYRNGEFMVVLENDNYQLVYFDGERRLPIQPATAGMYVAESGGRARFFLRLMEVDGAKVVFMNGKAFVREEG